MNAARGQPGARARGVVRPRVQTWRSVACLAFTEGGPDELWSGGASASRRANEEAAGAVPAAAAATRREGEGGDVPPAPQPDLVLPVKEAPPAPSSFVSGLHIFSQTLYAMTATATLLIAVTAFVVRLDGKVGNLDEKVGKLGEKVGKLPTTAMMKEDLQRQRKQARRQQKKQHEALLKQLQGEHKALGTSMRTLTWAVGGMSTLLFSPTLIKASTLLAKVGKFLGIVP
ncbi:septum site-determining [Micractinium conductrix]|uniref:Septum site-determining n=1 Tax=Micractinium conductrix TaxID=554055 RepID=A0A2P6V8M7_9CHLO|nr:septum site-determining [Micractinium conductrix]|eukprot:PSC70442.1 septum site-determining [Micractinium conductrix]